MFDKKRSSRTLIENARRSGEGFDICIYDLENLCENLCTFLEDSTRRIITAKIDEASKLREVSARSFLDCLQEVRMYPPSLSCYLTTTLQTLCSYERHDSRYPVVLKLLHDCSDAANCLPDSYAYLEDLRYTEVFTKGGQATIEKAISHNGEHFAVRTIFFPTQEDADKVRKVHVTARFIICHSQYKTEAPTRLFVGRRSYTGNLNIPISSLCWG